jgi:phosphoribosylformylglycinamidine (FGAM) synthase-like enzyme
VALAELALHSGIGADIDLEEDALAWFGEGAGRVVIASPSERAEGLEGARLRRIGVVRGSSLLGIPLETLRSAYEGAAA